MLYYIRAKTEFRATAALPAGVQLDYFGWKKKKSRLFRPKISDRRYTIPSEEFKKSSYQTADSCAKFETYIELNYN